MKRFSIDYYDGEDVDIPVLKSEHDSIKDAAYWCKSRKVPLSVVRITEWDIDGPMDCYGVFDIVGECNLSEAFEKDYENLDF